MPKDRKEVILNNGCQWMGAEIGKDEFCNGEKVPGFAYYKKHCRRVYNEPTVGFANSERRFHNFIINGENQNGEKNDEQV